MNRRHGPIFIPTEDWHIHGNHTTSFPCPTHPSPPLFSSQKESSGSGRGRALPVQSRAAMLLRHSTLVFGDLSRPER